MGLFDQAADIARGWAGQGGAAGNSLPAAVMQWISAPETGGLSGLVDAFRQGGLGEVFNSWVSTGSNLPISPEQIQSVLGSERVQAFAGQLGIDTGQASGQLAALLPQVIDKLTPTGSLPEGSDLMSQGMNLLKGNLFG